MINDKQIGDLIESSGGVWVEDEFRISSKELDALLVEAARATPADRDAAIKAIAPREET